MSREGDWMLNLTEKSIRASIFREVQKLDPAAKINKSWPIGFSVLDEEIRVEIRQDRSRSYHGSPTGRWRAAVGEWHDTDRFAGQKNDFDYAAIAALMAKKAEGMKLSRKHTAQLKRAEKAFKKTKEYKVLDALGVSMYDGTTDHSSVEILKKLSPAAFAELVNACGVK